MKKYAYVYKVDDVDIAIELYGKQLGFHQVMHTAPGLGMLSRGDLPLVLSAPNPAGGGGQPMPDDTKQRPRGWYRFAIEVRKEAPERSQYSCLAK